MSRHRLYLVSCVSKKLARPAAARDLYASAWFIKARAYVEAREAPWLILSARHGLVDPAEVIAPYETTLNRMTAADRRRWATRVIDQMEARAPVADEIIILAGRYYRADLMAWLQARFARVSVPMEGLGIGSQLQWLSCRSASTECRQRKDLR